MPPIDGWIQRGSRRRRTRKPTCRQRQGPVEKRSYSPMKAKRMSSALFRRGRPIVFESLKVPGQLDCGKTWFRNGFVTGHDFSRAEEQAEKCRASAPAGFAFCRYALAAAKAGSFLGSICGATEFAPCYKAFLTTVFRTGTFHFRPHFKCNCPGCGGLPNFRLG